MAAHVAPTLTTIRIPIAAMVQSAVYGLVEAVRTGAGGKSEPTPRKNPRRPLGAARVSHLLPRSLYLQLQDRLGPLAVRTIGYASVDGSPSVRWRR